MLSWGTLALQRTCKPSLACVLQLMLAVETRLRQQAVDELVGQHEVDDGIHVGVGAEILAVIPAEGCVDAMVLVQHACHAVKAEAVKPVKHAAICRMYVVPLDDANADSWHYGSHR